MDWITFAAEVIKAIAWPVTVLIIFLILRPRLMALVPLIQRLRFQGVEVDFSRQVQELALEVRSKLPPLPDGTDTQRPLRDHWMEVSQFSPRAVVLEAWLQVEKAAVEAIRRHGVEMKSTDLRSPLILGQGLEQAGILGDETAVIYHQLRNLRNAAAHASDFSFTADSAIEYADLATRLTLYLRKA